MTAFFKKHAAFLCLSLGALVLLAACLWIAGHTQSDLLAHGPFDSYTLQALAWRQGKTYLSGDYPWLELAVYQGRYYVSFPPTPTVPMLLLSFFFDANTPNALMTLIYFLGGYGALFFLCLRYLSPGQAALTAVFVCLGGSLTDLAVSGASFGGGVWYQAQMLGFLLTALSFLLVDGGKKAGWGLGLVSIALAVGCRPLNALYVPALLMLCYGKLRRETIPRTLGAMLPYVAAPALIACLYGAYNAARFGNPLEFGHAYLPEYTNSGDSVFALSKLPENLRNIFRSPWLAEGRVLFPTTMGFAVYITNPMLFLGGGRALERSLRRRSDCFDLVVCLTVVIHGLCLLSHRTNGGWQYGTRYLCDTLPALCLLFVRGRTPARLWESLLMGVLLLCNVYGTVLFHFL